MPNDTLWTGASLDDLRSEFGDIYEGRTILVTGADGFMGSHLTDALVELGATVPASRRSSRARASAGSTAILIDCAASVTTMKTP